MGMLQNQFVLEIISTFAFALSGALAASRKQMDFIGICFCALSVGVAGGTLRDVLLDRPVFWVNEPYSLSVCICIFVAVLTTTFPEKFIKIKNLVNYVDAFAIAFFSVQGYLISINMGCNILISVILGTATAAFGGLVRDISLNRIPFIFKGQLYCSVIISGLVLFAIFDSLIFTYAWILILRLLAIIYNVSFPIAKRGNN